MFVTAKGFKLFKNPLSNDETAISNSRNASLDATYSGSQYCETEASPCAVALRIPATEAITLRGSMPACLFP